MRRSGVRFPSASPIESSTYGKTRVRSFSFSEFLASIRRFDVFKAFFGLCGQALLSAAVFPVLPGATKYAMGVLKRSLHNCFFCYHGRRATLEEEVGFFQRRLGSSRTLEQLLALRDEYRCSFAFVIRCLPTLVRLHLRTAFDNRFPREILKSG